MHEHDLASRRRTSQKRLAIVLGITLAYTAAEIAGGILSNSLALLADAGHMLTDDLALGLAVAAGWLASRPPDRGRTYGYQRAEILAASVNAATLVGVCGFILWEAVHRFAAPPRVATGLMAAVAFGGLLVNVAGAYILRGHTDALNARAAFLHLLGDLLGSVGALAAAGAMAIGGFWWADPLASVLIAAIILFGSFRVLAESFHVLMEGAPSHLDAEAIRRELLTVPGVTDVHDLHLWTLGGQVPLLTAHLVVDHAVRGREVLRSATARLADRFEVRHATLQIERPDFNIIGPGSGAVDSCKGSP
jgi:cobalt-zinc-cadmium efflux system protein